MKDENIISCRECSEQGAEPFTRLLKQLDPADVKNGLPPTSVAAVERFKHRFVERIRTHLSIARKIIHDALVADGRSEAAAHAEVERFSREVSAVVKQFGLDAISDVITAEEIARVIKESNAVSPLLNAKPVLPGGVA